MVCALLIAIVQAEEGRLQIGQNTPEEVREGQ
ncbi:hypothetical protein PC128_g8069 [Phytophthora cactorum]|nr:hypothetical protein PC128_g8069 [Phytophthora cactorum]